MKVFKHPEPVIEAVSTARQSRLSIGFVPTMGALHNGHISLIQHAKNNNGMVVVSIFVNPMQFNNPDDLLKYPRDLNGDLAMLAPLLEEDDVVFAPGEEDIYPEPDTRQFDLGGLAQVMEGKFRPGHFNGVAIVVDRLFRIVSPDNAYFGEKDFQQLSVIRKLVEINKQPVNIVGCTTMRESDGLAMSSRNVRLTPAHRNEAPVIYRAMTLARSLSGSKTPYELKSIIREEIEKKGLLQAEYIEFAAEDTLRPVTVFEPGDRVRCFVAIQAGEVRLIDNLAMYE